MTSPARPRGKFAGSCKASDLLVAAAKGDPQSPKWLEAYEAAWANALLKVGVTGGYDTPEKALAVVVSLGNLWVRHEGAAEPGFLARLKAEGSGVTPPSAKPSTAGDGGSGSRKRKSPAAAAATPPPASATAATAAAAAGGGAALPPSPVPFAAAAEAAETVDVTKLHKWLWKKSGVAVTTCNVSVEGAFHVLSATVKWQTMTKTFSVRIPEAGLAHDDEGLLAFVNPIVAMSENLEEEAALKKELQALKAREKELVEALDALAEKARVMV